MNPNEVEFLAEKQLVSIVPNFSFGPIYLISGSVGPFRAGLPVKVPIWLALNLKQQQKCRIIGQDWMNVEELHNTKEIEKQERVFTRMPSNHFMEETQMLLKVGADDISDGDGIRTAIKDLWDIRMAKLRSSIVAFVQGDSGSTHAKLDHLTTMEINSVRPLLPSSLDEIIRIQNAPVGPGPSGPTQSSQSQ